ncbi:hypothetical protein [Mesorhizobium sp.]|uniref:hypothetical protein n=1 Tax=Mesorhizobium sp. TaxID=1871066 RepID=UPI00257AA786|nr:hypothetical protein [Mesorhizobium sp.]
MARTSIAALMHRHALAAVEDLDGACRGPQIDLLANEAVGHGIKEGLELDVIIRRDAGQTPFGKLVILQWKTGQSRALAGLDELPATDAQPAHDVVVDAIERLGNGGIGLSQREERLPPHPAQDTGLGETHSILHFRFLSSPGLQFVLTLERV